MLIFHTVTYPKSFHSGQLQIPIPISKHFRIYFKDPCEYEMMLLYCACECDVHQHLCLSLSDSSSCTPLMSTHGLILKAEWNSTGMLSRQNTMSALLFWVPKVL